jgi:hypothetical protein
MHIINFDRIHPSFTLSYSSLSSPMELLLAERNTLSSNSAPNQGTLHSKMTKLLLLVFRQDAEMFSCAFLLQNGQITAQGVKISQPMPAAVDLFRFRQDAERTRGMAGSSQVLKAPRTRVELLCR